MKRSVCLALALSTVASAQITSSWKFAISGDSRNCGDIVMPAVAQGVRQSQAEFYWHLGDFRAIYTFDEDMVPPTQLGPPSKPLNIIQYEGTAWPDFITRQLVPFGDLPVFLSPGNHETIPPATRDAYLIQFADWLGAPVLREQRLRDDPQDHKLRTYYHWVKGNVDFIALDNASGEQFDAAQMKWIHSVIDRDEKSGQISSIVVGMHEALPGSLGDSHSMSESAQGDKSGREVYQALLHAQDSAHKHVYVFASHSHFFMEDVFRTDTWKGKVLPGWIVGTAGAVRYRLPPGVKPGAKAMTDLYGFVVATVAPDGSISTSFRQLMLDDLQHANPKVPEPLVRWCYEQNKQQ
jgi:3',5'-cyclic AMP phosphodiesterase CpdA